MFAQSKISTLGTLKIYNETFQFDWNNPEFSSKNQTNLRGLETFLSSIEPTNLNIEEQYELGTLYYKLSLYYNQAQDKQLTTEYQPKAKTVFESIIKSYENKNLINTQYLLIKTHYIKLLMNLAYPSDALRIPQQINTLQKAWGKENEKSPNQFHIDEAYACKIMAMYYESTKFYDNALQQWERAAIIFQVTKDQNNLKEARANIERLQKILQDPKKQPAWMRLTPPKSSPESSHQPLIRPPSPK